MARGSRRKRTPPLELAESGGLSHTALQRLRRGEYAHVAQAYLDNGSPGVAEELVRGLKGWAKRRMLAA